LPGARTAGLTPVTRYELGRSVFDGAALVFSQSQIYNAYEEVATNLRRPIPEYIVMPLSLTSATADAIADTTRPEIASEDGFARAYDQHSVAVYRYVASRVGTDAAEDVTAETFAVAWRGRHNYSPLAGTAQAWLLGVATKVIARHREAEQRWLRHSKDAARRLLEPPPNDDLASVDQRLDAEIRRAVVYAALARLPARDREAFLIHVIVGASYDEIADALDIPVGTVRSRINRARNRMQTRLGQGNHLT
jgi:RNA polymerase sigma-70 factor (ECF subfamily)